MYLLNLFWRKDNQTKTLWHASCQLFDSFDPQRIGINSSKYGHGFYFCHSATGAKGAEPSAKYLYRVELDGRHIREFIEFDKRISAQGARIKAAALALKDYDPLSRHSDPLTACGDYLRQAAESATANTPSIYSRDKLLEHGVKGLFVADGQSESDRIAVVYDQSILRIRSIEFI